MTGKVAAHMAVETYVHLGPNGTSIPLEVTNRFWQDMASGTFSDLGPGRLVSTYEFKESWTTWEKHPAGEEVVVLLAGAMDLVLAADGREETVSLDRPGQFLIVPRDVWHTADVPKGALALFITAGEGTQNRPRE